MSDAPAKIYLTPAGNQWNNAWVNAHPNYVPKEGDEIYHHDDKVTAERSIGITEGDVVAHMNVASLHGELMAVKARAETAEARIEELVSVMEAALDKLAKLGQEYDND